MVSSSFAILASLVTTASNNYGAFVTVSRPIVIHHPTHLHSPGLVTTGVVATFTAIAATIAIVLIALE